MAPTIGKVYLLRGGLILRYQGRFREPARKPHLFFQAKPCLAFRDLRDGVSEPPSGYSCLDEDVLRELTASDVPWIEARCIEAQVRNLTDEVDGLRQLVQELRVA